MKVTLKGLNPRFDGAFLNYNSVRQVKTYERIAACVGGGQSGCTCYSDQATPLAEVTDAMCRDYVKNGIPFNPYKDTQPVQTAYSKPADTPATTMPAK